MTKKSARVKIAEVDVARPVVQHLMAQGWDVYQEVQSICGIADIVAVLDKRVWIIEAKTSLSLALIAQARRWVGYAHWVSIAVPMKQNTPQSDARRLGMDILMDLGIGTMTVVFSKSSTTGTINEHASTQPRMLRRPHLHFIKAIRDGLVPQQKDFVEAGSISGSHWTPYKESCNRIWQYVKRHNGCTVKEMVDSVGKYHYSTASSARSSISAMARGGHIPGVVTQHEDGKLRLFIEHVDQK